MPRIAEGRPAAKPSSNVQKDRYQRILRAAAKLGAEHGLDHVQMNDVARQANVAIATLYRYFPSKVDLFSSVMRWRVGEYDQGPDGAAVADPVAGVADLLIRISREMVRMPKLSLAMIQANSQAYAMGSQESAFDDVRFARIVQRAAGMSEVSEEGERQVRLIISCWFGTLVSLLNGRFSVEDAEDDIRAACALLLRPLDD
ncbi:TetR family transcriptional regulator [Nocardioides sp. SLBN-35]|uniref:TetR family transcriptional regulator n=1 Tax=Nocardioides sp. SLBN-35 TaxID=2768445 RepID=UPI001167D5D3|nr:TetR family transcriptional regulator [Nocardioides sp. SLBN-35]TQK72004.1 TetR family transcriptional regulator [Nocardioides sp. SLBN-35]